MKNRLHVLCLLILSVSLIGYGCGSSDSDNDSPTDPTATYSLQGTWNYTMIQGANTWDSGTFTFSGSDTQGAYLQVNIYDVEYTGNYSVSGADVTLTREGETFQGTFSDANTISGNWTVGNDSGTWTASRQ